MSHSFKFIVCFIFLLVSGELYSQETESKIGFGVNFSKDIIVVSGGSEYSPLTLPFDFSNFSIIIINKAFRFEPSLGYYRSDSESKSASSGYSSEYSSSNWRLGATVAYNKVKEAMNYYYGLHLGFVFTSSSSSSSSTFESNSDDDSKTDFFVGPVIGGEYKFIEHFSLGGEIQINYVILGQYDNDNSDYERSESAITSRASIILRWYL